jgi:hypothetical protein
MAPPKQAGIAFHYPEAFKYLEGHINCPLDFNRVTWVIDFEKIDAKYNGGRKLDRAIR